MCKETFKIRSLHIYPVKGLRGISVPQVYLEERGLQYDRRWLLVDDDGQFLSQRNYPQMAKFITSLENDILRIEYNSDSIAINTFTDEIKNVNIWGVDTWGYVVDPEVSAWFSQHLETGCHLIHMGEETIRMKAIDHARQQSMVSYADGYPLLLLGTASVVLLNENCNVEIPANRFRPNMIIETNKPHEEDHWQEIQFPNASVEVIKPCARCQVINVDQMSAEKYKEPLRTLLSYRRDGNKVNFGANAICLVPGTISVGDIIEV